MSATLFSAKHSIDGNRTPIHLYRSSTLCFEHSVWNSLIWTGGRCKGVRHLYARLVRACEGVLSCVRRRGARRETKNTSFETSAIHAWLRAREMVALRYDALVLLLLLLLLSLFSHKKPSRSRLYPVPPSVSNISVPTTSDHLTFPSSQASLPKKGIHILKNVYRTFKRRRYLKVHRAVRQHGRHKTKEGRNSIQMRPNPSTTICFCSAADT